MPDNTKVHPSAQGSSLSDIDDIINDIAAGKMVIMVDDEDRENEGDLIMAAEKVRAEDVNYMATHGRGLICLTLGRERCKQLRLPLMVSDTDEHHATNFTISIEAAEGITTGISAHDRARTVAVAIDPSSGPADIATPGHVFPVRAREGGVLVRAGHTEAAVDVARLAGMSPAGVICEIMNEDGTMARLPDLVAFAQRHALRIGTISDLIAYRRRHDNLVRETTSRTISSTIGGEWGSRSSTTNPSTPSISRWSRATSPMAIRCWYGCMCSIRWRTCWH